MAKKSPKRLPVPKKAPKVELPKKLYNRKRAKKEVRKLLEEKRLAAG